MGKPRFGIPPPLSLLTTKRVKIYQYQWKFLRLAGFESHHLRQFCKSLIFLPLNSWCLCWWLTCGAASVNLELIAMRGCLRSLCLRAFWSKHRETADVLIDGEVTTARDSLTHSRNTRVGGVGKMRRNNV